MLPAKSHTPRLQRLIVHFPRQAFAVSVVALLAAMCAPVARAESLSLEPSRDTYVDSTNPASSYGSLGLGTVSQNLSGSRGFFLLHFDVGSIPAGSVVSSATLKLRLGGCINGSDAAGNINTALYVSNGGAAWSESTTFQQVSTNGSSLDVFAASIVDCAPSSFVDFDMTDAVRHWVDQSVPNDGMVLMAVSGGDYWTRVFYTSEATASSRPKLSIAYTPPSESVDSPDGGPAIATAQPTTVLETASAANQPIAPDPSLNPPTKLTAALNNGSTVRLSWEPSNSDGVQAYRIFRREIGSDEIDTKIAEVAATTRDFTDTMVEVGKSYTYFLRTVRNDKESLNTDTVRIAVEAPATRLGNVASQTINSRGYYGIIVMLCLVIAALGLLMGILYRRHRKLHQAHHQLKHSIKTSPKSAKK